MKELLGREVKIGDKEGEITNIKDNIVVISEYNMPDDFNCIWEKERKVLQKSDRVTGDKAVEKLFVWNGGVLI